MHVVRRRRLTRSLAAGGLMVAAVAAGAWTVAARHHTKAKPAPSRLTSGTAGTSPSTTAAPLSPIFVGPAGVEARWVIAENQRPGSATWQIIGTPPGTIAGFADHVYAQVGDTVAVYVSTDAATFHVDAYRMGYYDGTGARLVWSSPSTPGQVQPPCPLTSGINMVACDNWTPTLDLTVTSAFVPGDYLLKLVGDGGQESYVPLTVWDPSSHATYVIKNDVYTWQAWNPYGGYDFYQGVGRCPPRVYPLCSRARIVSYDRPYAYGQGAADFLGSEYPLVRFAEQHGLDVTYATDLTLEQDPTFLANHTTLMSLGHDECWSFAERTAAETAEQHGMNLAFFAASPVLRHVRLQASPIGPDREVVDYRDSTADPLDGHGDPRQVTGNTWSSPPANWPETPLVGESYSGFLEPNAPPDAFVVTDASSWIFAGTGLQDGSTLPGILATDFDQFDLNSHPANLEIFAHSPINRRQAQSSRSVPYSDMTYWTDPASGAGIFDSGVNSWIAALSGPEGTVVGQITGNLLAALGQGPAGLAHPATANWHTFYP